MFSSSEVFKFKSTLSSIIALIFIFFVGAVPARAAIEATFYKPEAGAPWGRDCNNLMCRNLLNLIEGADSSIEFALYSFRNQPKILAALKRAKARGVSIRGVIEAANQGRHKSDKRLGSIADLRFNSSLLPKGSKKSLRNKLMHHKFFIFDRQSVWLGSANLTTTGIGGYNANVVATIEDTAVAVIFLKEFNRLFTVGGTPSGIESQENVPAEKRVAAPLAMEGVSVFFSPHETPVENALLPLLEKAENSIDLALFIITHKKLAKALVAAQKRGVKVRGILDANGVKSPYSKHQNLRKGGVDIVVENWGGMMHMKTALIDGRHVVLGSMNWTNSGGYRNDENLLVIEHPEIAKAFATFFEATFSNLKSQLGGDPLPESPSSIGSCSDGIDNDFDGQIDNLDRDCGLFFPRSLINHVGGVGDARF